jgi:hypothetical protein
MVFRNRKNIGKRHQLLYYRHTMDRLWRFALLVVIVLAIVWWFKSFGRDIDLIIFASAAMALVVMVFAIMARNMGYVQAFGDHLRLVTPFLRLKIAYRRIHEVGRPQLLRALFRQDGRGRQHQRLSP